MRLSGARRTEALAGQPPRRRPWRIRLAIVVSLLIHVTIGVFLLVTIRRENKPELLPPPAAVTMLFESGRKSGPTLPNPDMQTAPFAPPVLELPPSEETQRPTAPLPLAPAPLPLAPAPPPSAPPEPAAPPAEMPPPPPAAEQEPVPQTPRPPKPSPVANPTPAPKSPAQPKPSDFPPPMNFSFGTPQPASPAPARSRSRPPIPGTIDMSLGPASRGTADPTPFSERDEDAAAADWRNALSRWVAEHAYYPEQARREFQEGDAKVHVVADPNGRVRSVELIGKSGSMWLDLALLALFRDQRLPPLPRGEKEPIEFNFTMHYVLVRSR